MGIRQYIKEIWLELWNPDSRIWQLIDRILFALLPVIALLSVIISKTTKITEGWRDIMTNLIWIIPLAVWLLFLLLVVPYRLASKYHRQRNEAQELYKPIEELANIKSGDIVKGRDINVSLMFQKLNSNPTREAERHNILDNVTFDHCNLHGPCLITFEGEWGISACGFFGIGKIKANVPLQQATEGLGKFVHCRFRFCNFHNMSFYLIEKDMAEFSKICKP